MDRKLLGLGIVVGGAVLYYAYRKGLIHPSLPSGVPSGTLAVTPSTLGNTVTVTLTAKLVSGTPPVTISGTMAVTDSSGNQIQSWSISDTIYSVGSSSTIIKTFTGAPGATYSITAQVTFKNQWGSDTKTASTKVTIPGTAPQGALSISASVS